VAGREVLESMGLGKRRLVAEGGGWRSADCFSSVSDGGGAYLSCAGRWGFIMIESR